VEEYLFASTLIIAHHFISTVLTIKDILHRKLRMRKFSGREVPHFLRRTQKVARVEASKEMFRILQESEVNNFEEIVMNDVYWFQRCYLSSKMSTQSRAGVFRKADNRSARKEL
jgi:hypothetical protein